MFGSSGTHEERLLERTLQQIYEGKTMASILSSLSWRDRMIVLEHEKKRQECQEEFDDDIPEIVLQQRIERR